MNQEQKLEYLILYLVKQTQKDIKNFVLPSSYSEKRSLFRALMNTWQVSLLSEEFLQIQNSFLQEELKEKQIQTLETLKPIQKSLYVWQGDITLLAVDAIVNAANSSLLGCFIPEHRCIDNVIHSAAGLQLRKACYDIIQQQGHKEETGQVKITSAYNLPSKYILHTVGPIIINGVTQEKENLLISCYKSCLDVALKNNLKSLAFCCISTGEFHFPNDRACELAINTVKDFLDKNVYPMQIVFNVFKDLDYQLYLSALK